MPAGQPRFELPVDARVLCCSRALRPTLTFGSVVCGRCVRTVVCAGDGGGGGSDGRTQRGGGTASHGVGAAARHRTQCAGARDAARALPVAATHSLEEYSTRVASGTCTHGLHTNIRGAQHACLSQRCPSPSGAAPAHAHGFRRQ
eukprot:3021429-Prymnesium_polylepis.1